MFGYTTVVSFIVIITKIDSIEGPEQVTGRECEICETSKQACYTKILQPFILSTSTCLNTPESHECAIAKVNKPLITISCVHHETVAETKETLTFSQF